MGKAQVLTIRLRLLKIGAVVIRNTRRIRLLLPSHQPGQHLWLAEAEVSTQSAKLADNGSTPAPLNRIRSQYPSVRHAVPFDATFGLGLPQPGPARPGAERGAL